MLQIRSALRVEGDLEVSPALKRDDNFGLWIRRVTMKRSNRMGTAWSLTRMPYGLVERKSWIGNSIHATVRGAVVPEDMTGIGNVRLQELIDGEATGTRTGTTVETTMTTAVEGDSLGRLSIQILIYYDSRVMDCMEGKGPQELCTCNNRTLLEV